jgi:hypothetical protein
MPVGSASPRIAEALSEDLGISLSSGFFRGEILYNK